jgi:small-conductance mechanosensitive channel
MVAGALLFIPKIVVALVVFVITLVVAGATGRLVDRVLKKRETDPELTLLMTRLARWAVIGLGCVVSLQQVDFDLTAFLTGLGILGFTFGFAIQDVSKNFIAGVLLLLQQPFDIGDAIEVAGYSGTVVTVDLRATELLTFDGKNVLIPNADVFTSPIVHFGRGNRRRIDLSVGVAYDSDLERVKRTAVETISQVEGVLDDPVPNVVFDALAESTVDFTLYYWIDTEKIGLFDAKDKGVRTIKRTFEDAGIEIPYPIQTVRLEK